MRRTWVAALIAVGTVAILGTATDGTQSPGFSGEVSSASPAHAAFPGVASPAIGALFSMNGSALGTHFCTASVVHSEHGDLLVTAAHCVADIGPSAFVPGYHDGRAPFGIWPVDKVFVDPHWSDAQDPDLDFAFVSVRRADDPHSIESVVGANRLGVDEGFGNEVVLTGYPNVGNPVSCHNTTARQDTYQLRIDCPGFPDGTSGTPWISGADPVTKRGTVIGVIGGFQGGGATPDVSYSSYFDADIEALYRSADAE